MIDGMDKINNWNIESFQQELDEVQDDWKSFGRKYAQLSDFIHVNLLLHTVWKLNSGQENLAILEKNEN